MDEDRSRSPSVSESSVSTISARDSDAGGLSGRHVLLQEVRDGARLSLRGDSPLSSQASEGALGRGTEQMVGSRRRSAPTRFRSFVFTLNNYSVEDIARLSVPFAEVRYICFQREIAPSSGTRHLQGYAYSDSARSVSAWQAIIGRGAHIERARGTPEQCRDYCTKEETREEGTEPIEWGELPNQG